ncbi:MAG: PAS domain S-box protein [Nitrospirota bacterium]
MKDKYKTKEQLIDELLLIPKKLKKTEASFIENKQVVKTLRSFEKAIETMQIGVTIIDLEGNILYSNPADLVMHGYSAEEIEGKNVRIFAPEKNRKSLTVKDMSSLTRWKRESVNIRKDGNIFLVQLMSDVIKNSEGTPVGVVTTCEDITDRKNMENEIKERIKELEIFYEAAVNRELKMKELKKEIQKLKDELSQYKEKTYH